MWVFSCLSRRLRRLAQPRPGVRPAAPRHVQPVLGVGAGLRHKPVWRGWRKRASPGLAAAWWLKVKVPGPSAPGLGAGLSLHPGSPPGHPPACQGSAHPVWTWSTGLESSAAPSRSVAAFPAAESLLAPTTSCRENSLCLLGFARSQGSCKPFRARSKSHLISPP